MAACVHLQPCILQRLVARLQGGVTAYGEMRMATGCGLARNNRHQRKSHKCINKHQAGGGTSLQNASTVLLTCS